MYKLCRPTKKFFCLLASHILAVAKKVKVALVVTGLQQGLPGAAAREEERLVGRSPGVDRKSSVRSRGYFYGGSGGQR